MRRDVPREKASQLAAKLREDEADFGKWGDPTLLPREVTNDSASRIRATFGEEVAAAVETMPVHRWSEPIASGFGLHLIRLEDRIPGRLPSLEEVRPEVEREWSRELRQRTRDGYLESLSQRYQVTIEWPEPSPQS